MKRYTLMNSQEGFTLIEIIVTIIVAAILGAMFLQVMETNVTGSVEPLTRVEDVYDLNQVIERITADYKRLLSEENTLETIKATIGTTGTDVTSGVYGTYSVQYNEYIKFTGPDGEGMYQEEADDGSGGNRILKVTLSLGDQQLTSLFTE